MEMQKEKEQNHTRVKTIFIHQHFYFVHCSRIKLLLMKFHSTLDQQKMECFVKYFYGESFGTIF